MFNRLRLAGVLVALALLLLPSLSFAAGGSTAPWRSAPEGGPFEIVLDWLARGWAFFTGGEPPLDRAWQSSGCGIDPNGLPLPCPGPGTGTPTTSTTPAGGTDSP